MLSTRCLRPVPLSLALMLLVGSAGVAPAQAPATSAPLTLDQCIDLAMTSQPALAAARASLAAASSGQQALDNLPIYAKLLTRDLSIRQQQSSLGINIASAALRQAEWEARYAVTRNYYSVVYARLQQDLLAKILGDLGKARKRAKQLLDSGNPDVKVTKIDLDLFDINIDLLEARAVEAKVGEQKALAALREAIGLCVDQPFSIAPGTLPAAVADLDRDALVKLALANRGELTQASSAFSVTELEVAAQHKKRFGLKVGTFAGGSDIHAQQIPQGVANGEYRPGAFGLEMPPMLVGKRDDRVAHAADLSQRAGAVVDKTKNLIALETENSYLKWKEAYTRFTRYAAALPRAKDVEKRSFDRFNEGNTTGTEYIQAATLQDQIQAQYNEALYIHALALAALERITAGGYRITPAGQ